MINQRSGKYCSSVVGIIGNVTTDYAPQSILIDHKRQKNLPRGITVMLLHHFIEQI